MSKVSKFFKNKSQKVTIPDEAKQAPTPRAKDVIDKEYTQVCISIGDRTVKAKGLQQELDQMFRYVERLGAESEARLKLDAEEAAKAKSTADTLAPATTGVDANV